MAGAHPADKQRLGFSSRVIMEEKVLNESVAPACGKEQKPRSCDLRMAQIAHLNILSL